MEEFRKDLGGLEPSQVTDRLVIYAYELNRLLRFAHALGVPVHLDLVERDGYEELVLRGPEYDAGREGLR